MNKLNTTLIKSQIAGNTGRRAFIFGAVCALVGSAIPMTSVAGSVLKGLQNDADYRITVWEDLIPAGWDEAKILEKFDYAGQSDSAKAVRKAYKELMAQWAKAPANEGMDGKRIVIPAYIVPLDWSDKNELTEFLLVPEFGACIHTPPPPANQIIYVKSPEPLPDFQSMDTVKAYGVISIDRRSAKSTAGDVGTGYTMKLEKIEHFKYSGELQ